MASDDARTKHITVLRHEAVDALALRHDSIVFDATFGGGGHSSEICSRLGAEGKLIALDADPAAKQQGAHILAGCAGNARIHTANFRKIAEIAQEEGVVGRVDAVLADLGWRQEQFGGTAEQGGGKGFSFQADEPLAMTYGAPESYSFTAWHVVNEWTKEQLALIIRAYGEERYANRIADAICDSRTHTPISTARELADIITRAVPAVYRHGGINPATRTFQALRIAVNDELDALNDFLHGARSILASQGRIAIISFHSLEDRIVKHTFRAWVAEGLGELLTKKPITPSDAEVRENPRARSAKLRVFMAQ